MQILLGHKCHGVDELIVLVLSYTLIDVLILKHIDHDHVSKQKIIEL